LANGGVFKELEQFQNYLSDYKVNVYDGLSPDRVLFSGNSHTNKKLNLLHDGGHCNVITNLKAPMEKSTYVTCVTHCMTIHASVTEFIPYVQRDHLVTEMG